MTYPATLAVQSQTFAEYLFKGAQIEMADDRTQHYAKLLASFSLIWIIMFLNFFSIQKIVSRFQVIASCAKLAATLLIIAIGFWSLFVKVGRFMQIVRRSSCSFSGQQRAAQPAI